MFKYFKITGTITGFWHELCVYYTWDVLTSAQILLPKNIRLGEYAGKESTMKRLIVLSVMLVMVVALMAGTASAASQNAFFVVNLTAGGTASDSQFVDLDLGSNQAWTVNCTGGTTLSATTASAVLTGGFATDKVWNFQYLDSSSNWVDIISGTGLVSGSTAASFTTVVSSQNSLPVVVTTQWLRIAYDASLSSNAAAVAAGTATVSAMAIPEPSSAVVLLTGLVGVVGFLKRKK